jgi:hypothetical protein
MHTAFGLFALQGKKAAWKGGGLTRGLSRFNPIANRISTGRTASGSSWQTDGNKTAGYALF